MQVLSQIPQACPELVERAATASFGLTIPEEQDELTTRRALLNRALFAVPALLPFTSLSCMTTRPAAPPADDKSLRIGGAVITYSITGDDPPLPAQQIVDWIAAAARTLTAYFGHFPVKRVEIAVTIAGGGKISGGVTYSGRRIEIRIGRRTTPRDLERDWMMIHEMFHLAFPTLDRRHIWMGEGLSTYLEPLARARVGNMTAQQVWGQFARSMPQGLPRPGDEGLDHTHTWGRTYWGGALFWLQADVEIREQTGNQRSLDTAIRAILEAGGNGSAPWPVGRVLATGDRATATNVLSQQYEQFANAATAPDLPDLWRKLGVQSQGTEVQFDENAPQADARRAMTNKN